MLHTIFAEAVADPRRPTRRVTKSSDERTLMAVVTTPWLRATSNVVALQLAYGQMIDIVFAK
ncbi:MAG: hypothetical protein IPL05_05425 [Betaproteobacteria bacterium]|nr:hypothetical protein [Betaproteobacteria bacterium]